MAGVVQKFLLTSMIMWMVPIAIIYGFNHRIFPVVCTRTIDCNTKLWGKRKSSVDLLFLDNYWLERERIVGASPNNLLHMQIYFNLYNSCIGSSQLSSSSQTLISGFLAVISVNFVIALYIIMAMKEPTNQEAQPDPTFLAEAKRSITQPSGSMASENSETRDKME